MSDRYKHMISPFRLPNGVILRNRMIVPPSEPHYIQAGENFPSEGIIMHYALGAQNGAALVTCDGCYQAQNPSGHHMQWDVRSEGAQHYMTQLADAVHFYGAKANVVIMPVMPQGHDVSAGAPCPFPGGVGPLEGPPPYVVEEMPRDMIYELIESWAQQAKLCADAGFDGTYIHMSYRATLGARFISPVINRRTDEFGGSLENRIRFSLLLCRRIKELCGDSFIIECSVSGHDMLDADGRSTGVTLDDTIEFARRARGVMDIMTLRSPHIDPQHPTGFNPKHMPWAYMAEAVKKADTGVAVAASGGLFYPGECEKLLADGGADLLSMARAFVSNPDYGKCVYEGRGENIVPCLRCNKCHMLDSGVQWHSACVVNPRWANEIRVDRLIAPVERIKKVAVVGGGPAGMKAALEAASRGHNVTIYEKSGELGGLIKHAKYADFKWPMLSFLRYLDRKVRQSPNINLRLDCEPKPEMLRKERYDVLIAALGSSPAVPPIKGADSADFLFAVDAFAQEKKLGHRVVIVGGSEIGAETGLYLARCGHEVTVVCRQPVLAMRARRVHYYSMFAEALAQQPGLTALVNAVTTEIRSDGIRWRSTDGGEHELACDSVVLSCGATANAGEAMRYAGCADEFYAIGDCDRVGNLQKAIRAGFSIGNAI